MGGIKRKKRQYTRPRQLFDKTRIDQENVMVRAYGLKNKKEIWKAKSLVSKLRRRAKNLISKEISKQQELFNKLNNLGIKVTNTSDVLALTENDLLNRRLQTFVYKNKLANTAKQARQLIVHKHILVDGEIVNIPSFWITSELEKKIEVIPFKEKPTLVEEPEEESTENPIEELTKESTEKPVEEIKGENK